MLAATPIAELCTSWHSTSGDGQPQVVALQEDNNSRVSTLTKVRSEQRWCWAPAKILTGLNSWQAKKHSHRAAVQCTLLCAWCLQPTANRCTELQAGLNYSGAGGNYELVKMSVFWLNCLKLSPEYFWLSTLLWFLVMQNYSLPGCLSPV